MGRDRGMFILQYIDFVTAHWASPAVQVSWSQGKRKLEGIFLQPITAKLKIGHDHISLPTCIMKTM
jgi:hypothetical protein